MDDTPLIAPTHGWRHVAATDWDVVVVGAGPAGAMSALVGARLGLRTLLVDRSEFPRSKVCGGCLNRAALAELAAIDLPHLPLRMGGRPLRRFRLGAMGAEARIDMPEGIAISRTVFDAALIRAAIAAGSAFLPATTASDAGLEPAGRRVVLRQRARAVTVRARWIIAADGLAGAYTSGLPAIDVHRSDADYIGLAAEPVVGSGYARDTIHMACHLRGYAGLVNLENGRLHLAAAVNVGWLRQHRSPALAMIRILEANRWPIPPELASAQFRGTPRLRIRRRPVSIERVFLVGDAAGYVEPFTGEGIAWALRGGRAAALRLPAAIRGQTWRLAAADWAHAYGELVESRQRLCTLASHCLRRPVLTGWCVRVLGAAPWLARPFVAALNHPVVPEPPPPLPLS